MENGASAGAVFISFAKLHCYKFESVWPMKNDVNQEIRAQTGRNSLQNLRGKGSKTNLEKENEQNT